MASLTVHLRRPDDHGRLSFHPECPICRRERLTGALPADAIVGPRSRALFAAGVLALSSATPTAALAADPDQEQEGATAPEQIAGDGGSDVPEFDAAGQPTELPLDAGPAPEDSTASDPTTEPVPPGHEPTTDADTPEDSAASGPANAPAAPAQEPATDANAPIVGPGDGTGTQSGPDQPVAPADADPLPAQEPTPPVPTSEPPAAGSPAAMPPTDAPAAETQPTTPAAAETDAAAKAHARKREAANEKQQKAHATAPSRTYSPAAAQQPEPVYVSSGATGTATTAHPVQQQPAPSSPAGLNRVRAVQRGDHFHAVQQGESLWSIARDVLADGASAARIAREVNRLWELNSARIGTGDRDLLMVGTRIALR